MKASTILVSAMATLAAAAPTEKRGNNNNFDLSQLNNLQFSQSNLGYLNNINELDLQLLAQLGQLNNLNLNSFSSLFSSQDFQLQQLLQLQQLQDLLTFGQSGVLNNFDLSQLSLSPLNLGLLNNLGSVGLQQFVQPNVVAQVQTIAASVSPFALGSGIPGLASGGVISSGAPQAVSSGVSSGAAVSSNSATDGAVTDAEQNAQEGRVLASS